MLAGTLGLIGFHAVHKTASRPQWIWTSFEHVKQRAGQGLRSPPSKFDGPYNFFNVNCRDNCAKVNATPPRPVDPDPALQLKFRKDDEFKSQIVRETPLTHAAKNMNTIFHSMLHGNTSGKTTCCSARNGQATFPAHHCTPQIANAPAPKTDFLKQPDMTCSPAPTFLANSTLETYSQGRYPAGSSSCIGCHGNAVSFQQRAHRTVEGRQTSILINRISPSCWRRRRAVESQEGRAAEQKKVEAR